MAKCVDPDQMIHFRNYIIWFHTVYSHVKMHIVRTWSNQRLDESGKPASKTTGWMASCVDPDQMIQFRSYLIWVHTFWSRGQNAQATHMINSAFSKKQPTCVQNYWFEWQTVLTQIKWFSLGAMWSGFTLFDHVSKCTSYAHGQFGV